MNRNDIIRMAQEAGFGGGGFVMPTHAGHITHELERFAALVASAERESLRESFRVVTAAEASAAILHEREACAKVCDYLWEDDYSAYACAEAIRARGDA